MIKIFKSLMIAIAIFAYIPAFAADEANQSQQVTSELEDILTAQKVANDDFHLVLEEMWGSFIFDETGEGGGPIEPTLLSKTVGYTNVLALILGIIITSYVTLASVINTAQSGEVMGKQWSTYWLPIRTSMAFGLLIPTKIGALTLSTAQVIVIKLIIMSSTSATYLWENTVDNLIYPDGGGGTVPAQVVPAYNVGYATLAGLMCQIGKSRTEGAFFGYNEAKQWTNISYRTFGSADSHANESIQFVPSMNAVNATALASSLRRILGDFESSSSTPTNFIEKITFSEGECGSITFTAPESVFTEAATGSTSSSFSDELKQRTISSFGAYQSAYAKFITGLASNLALLSTDDKLSTSLVEYLSTQMKDNEKLPDSAIQTIDTLSIFFVSSLSEFARDTANLALIANGIKQDSATNLATEMKRGGWLYAGNFFFRMSQLEGVALKTTEATVSFTRNSPSCQGDDCGDDFAAAAMYMAGDAYTKAFLFSGNKDAALVSVDSLSPPAIDPSGITSYVDSHIISLLANLGVVIQLGDNLLQQEWDSDSNLNQSASNNPFQFAVNLGNGLNAARVFLQGVYVTTTVQKGFIDGAKDTVLGKLGGSAALGVLSALLEIFIEIVMVSIISLTAMGWTLAYYLPLMPAILWITLISAYLLISIEAVIATPLAVILMATPEGEGISGTRMQSAITMLASVFLRPSLMIVGLIVAIVVAKYSFILLNKIYWVQAGQAVGDGLFATFAVITIYITVLHQILSNSIMAMDSVPTAVLNWIGSNGGAGQFGQNEVKGMSASMDKSAESLSSAGQNFSKNLRGKMDASARNKDLVEQLKESKK